MVGDSPVERDLLVISDDTPLNTAPSSDIFTSYQTSPLTSPSKGHGEHNTTPPPPPKKEKTDTRPVIFEGKAVHTTGQNLNDGEVDMLDGIQDM